MMARNSPDTKSIDPGSSAYPSRTTLGQIINVTAKNEEKILKEAVGGVGGEAHVTCSRTRL